jgi:hypothetical protein
MMHALALPAGQDTAELVVRHKDTAVAVKGNGTTVLACVVTGIVGGLIGYSIAQETAASRKKRRRR